MTVYARRRGDNSIVNKYLFFERLKRTLSKKNTMSKFISRFDKAVGNPGVNWIGRYAVPVRFKFF